MNRLFGRNKKEAPPNLTDTISKVDNRAASLEQKIQALNDEIGRFREQLSKLPQNSPSREPLKQRALRSLQQRKIYEFQIAQLRQQSFNMEQTAFATETLKDTHETVRAMQHAARDMKKQFKHVDMNRVEQLQEDLQELMQSNEELQEIMGSRSFAVPDGIDEEELEAELAALEGNETEGDAGYLLAGAGAGTGTALLPTDATTRREKPDDSEMALLKQ